MNKIRMIVAWSAFIVGLQFCGLIVHAQAGTKELETLQSQIRDHLKKDEYEEAEALFGKELNLLKGLDSEVHAQVLCDHAAVLRHLFRYPEAQNEEQVAAAIRSRLKQHSSIGTAPIDRPTQGVAGKSASMLNTAPKGSDIFIPINPPEDFNFKTKEEILRRRIACVAQHNGLLKEEYTPSTEVYGQIADRRPWWGILGSAYYGSGEDSIKGRSLRSVFIANPYILVGIVSTMRLPSTVSPSAVEGLNLYCQPQQLTWAPRSRQLHVEYDMTMLVQEIETAGAAYKPPYHFDVQADNARDLGFPYMLIPSAQCTNLTCTSWASEPFAIRQFLHCGPSCGYPGGCNNLSPYCPELEFSCSSLPARMVVWLYRSKPSSSRQAPDFTCYIDIR